MAEKFRLIGDKIKKSTFGGKGRYSIPILIINRTSDSEYYIKRYFNYKSLKKNNYYYTDYNLLKLCEENLWNDICNNFKIKVEKNKI